MAILGALNNSAVHRLKHTFSALSPAVAAQLEHVKGVMSNSSSFATYRTKLAETSGPKVPYLYFHLPQRLRFTP